MEAMSWFQLVFDRSFGLDTDRSCGTIASRAKDIVDLMQTPAFCHASSFQIKLQECLSGKRLLFLAKGGRFGTGSLNIRPGDKIHFVSGVPVPLCLRMCGLGAGYQVIGPAMIDENGIGEIWRGKFRPIELL
ncbi:hypothetical protein GQ44DRAFT_716463 [Phaeosphaeriaceae sp. PMI808]|nr:hypothetical protein GQ44DRAFT_716463 [Phaeosphaeriaceae sp. PMI808]